MDKVFSDLNGVTVSKLKFLIAKKRSYQPSRNTFTEEKSTIKFLQTGRKSVGQQKFKFAKIG